jgi:hypothetical protein
MSIFRQLASLEFQAEGFLLHGNLRNDMWLGQCSWLPTILTSLKNIGKEETRMSGKVGLVTSEVGCKKSAVWMAGDLQVEFHALQTRGTERIRSDGGRCERMSVSSSSVWRALSCAA